MRHWLTTAACAAAFLVVGCGDNVPEEEDQASLQQRIAESDAKMNAQSQGGAGSYSKPVTQQDMQDAIDMRAKDAANSGRPQSGR